VGYNPAPRSSPEKREIIFQFEKIREERKGIERAEDFSRDKIPKKMQRVLRGMQVVGPSYPKRI
jgi:hypothetical protein